VHKLVRLAMAGIAVAALLAVTLFAGTTGARSARAATCASGCGSAGAQGPNSGWWASATTTQGSPGGGTGGSGGGGGSTATALCAAIVSGPLAVICAATTQALAVPNAAPPAPPPTPQMLALSKYASLTPPSCAIGTAPLAGSGSPAAALVGLPEWFWVQPAGCYVKPLKASVPGVLVTVTAVPSSLLINLGDGLTLTCPGLGTAYIPNLAKQTSDCTHRYMTPSAGQPGNVYVVSVGVIWTATWTATTGGGGALPSITTTATMTLPVCAARALVTSRNTPPRSCGQ
jgi:hypothetical protein